ncbi:MAG TPA: BMP family ABC transporter substrate-binding protein [Candidatus Limnocylindrales bacterium]|nr:BMP family ABC transporter substrate-binding protein [Candidatus Limnocylindrales bacterium]
MHVSKRLVALGAASAIFFAACGGGGATTAPATEAPASAPAESMAPESTAPESAAPSEAAVDYSGYKACVAFDTGGLGDKGFNDLAKKGLEDAGKLGFQTAFSEAQGATDYAANIQRLIDEGCNSIITVGFNQAQATVEAVKANEDINFGQVDAVWDEATNGATPANFTGIDFQIDEAGVLAGYLAAGFSKTGKIGTYGGQQFPGVTRFMDGLYAGIKIHNEKKGTAVELLGWDAAAQTGTFVGGDNPWGDPAKGEQLAQTFIDQGADIVHPVAGGTGLGTMKAMQAAGMWSIGVDTDQAISVPEYASSILTSSEKVIDVAVLDTFKAHAAGNAGGAPYIGTLANDGVRISPFHELDSQVSAELKAEIEALKAEIASGAVKVADYLK